MNEKQTELLETFELLLAEVKIVHLLDNDPDMSDKDKVFMFKQYLQKVDDIMEKYQNKFSK